MTNGNDPAFGTSEIVEFNSGPALAKMAGLTKRELFSAMAMQGFAADSKYCPPTIEAMARNCCQWADALIAALNEEKK